MKERGKGGLFAKGNKVGRKAKGVKKKSCPEIEEAKRSTKEEIVKCASSLLLPWNTLQSELKKEDATRLEYLTGMAISGLNYKFIMWLLEMAVGRPSQNIDFNNKTDEGNSSDFEKAMIKEYEESKKNK